MQHPSHTRGNRHTVYKVLLLHGSHFFGLTNFPDFSSFFCIFPVFFHQLFQYFLHFSSIFSSNFPVFSPFFQCFFHRLFQVQSDPLNLCSLNSSFLLNSSGKFENFESIIIDANVKLPSNSSPHLVHCKIFTYFSNELSRSYCICFLCSSNFHKFFQYLFYSIFSGFIFKEWPPFTIGSLYYKQMLTYYFM